MDQFKQNILLYVPHNVKVYDSKVKRTYTLTIDNFNESLNRKNDTIYLRPLGELTKEIEVDGFRFTPMRRFYDDYKLSFSTYEEFLDMMLISYLEPAASIHYYHFKLMVSWHFDVFGYIEERKAKDIKKYKEVGPYEPKEDNSINDLKYLEDE